MSDSAPSRVTLVSARGIHAVDEAGTVAECMAISGGRILGVGPRAVLRARHPGTLELDFPDAWIYPGLYDPHCHFLSYALQLGRADLRGARSWKEAVDLLVAHRERSGDEGGWLQGRGWDQNGWADRGFPDRSLLDKAFPDIAVVATRVDGHAAIANTAALRAAGFGVGTAISGGHLGLRGGELSGLLIDNAVAALRKAIPVPSPAAKRVALLRAQERCLAVGLTSISNAGTDREDLDLFESMLASGELRLGIYAMLHPTDANIAWLRDRGAAEIPFARGRLSARAFKMYADGALGSRGAWLLEPYADDPGNRGLSTLDPAELDRVCAIARNMGMQMNVHAIGDAAARMLLGVFGRHLRHGDGARWRIEHAQVVHPDDLPRFGDLGVIPSIQTTHATSDMAWIGERLGADRLGRAHRARSLLGTNGWLPNGSDFPIEGIDPLDGFHAAVARRPRRGEESGNLAFRPEESLAPAEALRAMTIWAARANFEDAERGSLEPGKLADFTVVDADLVQGTDGERRGAKVVATAVEGTILYDARSVDRDPAL